MKLPLVYLLILAFAFLKGNDPLFAAKQASVIEHIKYQCRYNNISGKTNKRSAVDLFAITACCDDDDDGSGSVKKKTTSAVSLFLTDGPLAQILAHISVKRSHHFIKHADQSSQPVYIFQRELLI